MSLLLMTTLVVYFLYNFFIITPYQYTYLNFFNGKNEIRYKNFENDYWGASIKELIKKTDFSKNKRLKLTTCGVEVVIAKNYFKKNGFTNFSFERDDNADFVIMTNRSISWNNKITNCFHKFHGENIYEVSKNRLILSVIRKNNLN